MNTHQDYGKKTSSESVAGLKHNVKIIKFSDFFWSIVWILVIILLILRIFVFQQVSVQGASMQPNYYERDMLLINQIDRNFKRGQVVAVYEDSTVAKNANYFTRFNPKTVFFLKRVIGLPGEEVEMVGGKVIIYNQEFPNGVLLNEDYIAPEIKISEELTKYYYKKTKVQPNTYFLLGDNRTNSTDSRKVGAFPDYSIFGQENLRYWPFSSASYFSLPNYNYTALSSAIIDQIKEYENTNNSFID
jgi:signal peptidase I